MMCIFEDDLYSETLKVSNLDPASRSETSRNRRACDAPGVTEGVEAFTGSDIGFVVEPTTRIWSASDEVLNMDAQCYFRRLSEFLLAATHSRGRNVLHACAWVHGAAREASSWSILKVAE